MAILLPLGLAGCVTRALPVTVQDGLAAIEARSGGRLGLALIGLDGALVAGHRAQERFAMCSTFKLPLAAMVLDTAAAGRMDLDDVLPVTDADMVAYAPYVEAQRARQPPLPVTIGGAAAAAVSLSDNSAANLLLARLGGPDGLTAWLRTKGDTVTRLDRREPELNENARGDPRDTTSPAAMAQTANQLVFGGGLSPAGQAMLFDWMKASSTGLKRIRAGLPGHWIAGDKTGSCGNAYHDVAAFIDDRGQRYTLAIYLDRPTLVGDEASAIVAQATQMLLTLLR